MVCAGSVGPGGETTLPAAQGTFAHDIAAQCLKDQTLTPMDFYLKRGVVDGHEIECDQEMVSGILVYLDYADGDLQEGDIEWVEMPLMEELQTIDKDLGGTADRVRYRPSTRELAINDFKYGAGVYVEVVDSKQQKMYALGVLLKVQRMGFKVDTIKNVVVQPRYTGAEAVRETTFKAVELLDFAADLQEACERTRQPNPPLVAGDHCGFCPKRIVRVDGVSKTCPELERHHHAIVAVNDVALLPAAEVAVLLASVPLAKQRIAAIEAHAYKLATMGVEIPDHKLVDKEARRKWKNDGDVIMWAQEAKVDPYAPREILSPAQLEEKVKATAPKGKKKEAAKVLEPFYEKVSSGTVLVHVSDSRPPHNRVGANDFAVVDGGAKPALPQAVINLF
jgi:hypothetical protein